MSTFNRFTPGAINGTLGCSTVTTSASLTGTGAVLRVANVSTVEAFVAVGSSTVAAVAGGTKSAASDGGLSIPGATITFVTLDPGVTHIAGITASSTATLRFNRGDGA
jgi:hypothetical protein